MAKRQKRVSPYEWHQQPAYIQDLWVNIVLQNGTIYFGKITGFNDAQITFNRSKSGIKKVHKDEINEIIIDYPADNN